MADKKIDTITTVTMADGTEHRVKKIIDENGDIEVRKVQDIPEGSETADNTVMADPTQAFIDIGMGVGRPELDPSRPEFNEEAYKKELKEFAKKSPEWLENTVTNLQKQLTDYFQNLAGTADKKQWAEGSLEQAESAVKALYAVLESEEWKEFKTEIIRVNVITKAITDSVNADEIPKKWADILPYMELELQDLQAAGDEQAKGLTAMGIIKQLTEDPNAEGSDFFQELEDKARKRKEEQEAVTAEAINVIANIPSTIIWAMDKVNANVFSLHEDGTQAIDFVTSKKSAKNKCLVSYEINFPKVLEELHIQAQLTEYDKQVYMAVSNLYANGNEWMSASMIYNVMGGKSRPNQNDIQRINESLTKMRSAVIKVSNESEEKTRYKKVEIDDTLLSFRRQTITFKNKRCESAIHLKGEPPLFTFARERNQITTFDRELLSPPLNKTDDVVALENYFVHNVAAMKSGSISNEMLFTTILRKCNITDKKQKQRAKDKMRTILDHYKKCGYIKSYKEEDDRLKIFF